MKITITIFLNLLLFHYVLSNEIHVPGDYATINQAVLNAQQGDSIIISEGTYSIATNSEVFPITISGKTDLHIIGIGDVIIDANEGPYDNTFYVYQSSNVFFSNLIIKNAQRKGMYIRESIHCVVDSCLFSDNEEGGISGFLSTITIKNSEITNTTWKSCNAISANKCTSYIYNNRIHNFHFYSSMANVLGIYIMNDDTALHSYADIQRNIIYETDCAVSIQRSSATIINNTLDNNNPIVPAATQGRGIVGTLCHDLFLDIRNNIVTNHTNDGIYMYHSPNSHIDYNNVWNNAQNFGSNYNSCSAGQNDISADPHYSNDTLYYLMSISPCIDTGDSTLPKDPDSTRVDMGAIYHHQEPNITEPTFDNETLVNIFPNPATESLEVNFEAKRAGLYYMRIFDSRGTIIRELKFTSNHGQMHHSKIDHLEKYPSGIYFLQIEGAGIHGNKPFIIK